MHRSIGGRLTPRPLSGSICGGPSASNARAAGLLVIASRTHHTAPCRQQHKKHGNKKSQRREHGTSTQHRTPVESGDSILHYSCTRGTLGNPQPIPLSNPYASNSGALQTIPVPFCNDRQPLLRSTAHHVLLLASDRPLLRPSNPWSYLTPCYFSPTILF